MPADTYVHRVVLKSRDDHGEKKIHAYICISIHTLTVAINIPVT